MSKAADSNEAFLNVIEAYVKLGEIDGMRRQRAVLKYLQLLLETKEKLMLEKEATP